MPRFRTCALATVLALALALPLAGAEDERAPLTAVEYDTIWMTNGGQIVGTIVGTQADGAVRFDRIGRPTTLVPKNEIQRIERKQTLPEAVGRRGEQAIAAADWTDVQRVLRFALEKKDDPKPEDGKKPDPKKPPLDLGAVKDAAIEVARKALAKKPTTEVAALAVQLAWDKNDTAGVIAGAQAGLAADPNWTPGYENQAKVYLAAKQDDRMRALVKVWLERQPTAKEANRYMAKLAEAAGDIKAATEAYRKGFDLHQDWESALGFARCSLKRGDRDECMRAAKALIDAGQFTDAARAWRGSALMQRGTPEADRLALTDLESALAGKPDDEAADVARYNLGLLHQRAGRVEEARKLWSQVKGPMGAVALAQLDHRPIDAGSLPAALKPFAAEHNACIELESRRWQGVLDGGLDLTTSKRTVFLGLVGQLLKGGGADDAIHNLAATSGDESLRWQAYGLMLQGRFKDAEALLDKLPVTDGWAIATRVYIAAARKDEAAAKSWLKRLDGATGVPRQYAQVLVAEFASANDEVMSESFDWPDPEAVATGWKAAAPGTNIAVHARDGKLVLEGTQAGAEPTCAYKLVAADRLRTAEITVATANLGAATGGLEVADDKRENGLQVGVSAGRVLWRSAEKGQWSNWVPAELPTVGETTSLRIELDKGRLFIALGSDPVAKVPVTASLGRGEYLAVGVFGVAEPGTAWTLIADDLTMQLRPVARR